LPILKSHHKKILLLLLIVAVAAAVHFSRLGDALTLDNLKQKQAALVAVVHANYPQSVAAFIAAYIMVTALAIPGAWVLTMAGGSVFGAALATLFVNAGATFGAALAFLAARYLLGNWIQTRYEGPLARFNEDFQKNGSQYLLSLRLVPLFPFFLINILSGLTRVPLGTFLWTTSLGIIPGSLLYAYAGQQISSISSAGEILSGRIVIALAALAFAVLLPAVIKRIKAARHQS
jgi:uncharacterized membrane protein YdjX (TVP38/TMEM64 family)